MEFLSPLTEEEKRRRARKSGVVEEGEYVSFDLAFRDSAPGNAVFLTDSQSGLSPHLQDAVNSLNALRQASGRMPITPGEIRSLQIADAARSGKPLVMNDAQAQLLEQQRAFARENAAALAVRDAARAAQYQG